MEFAVFMCHPAVKALNDCIRVVVHITGSAVLSGKASSDEKHPVKQRKIAQVCLTRITSKSKLPTNRWL